MHPEDSEDLRTYTVVRNDEEQYSIWFADREAPIGWSEVGFRGSKADCLAFVEKEWTDMRPRSVREFHATR